MPRTALYSLVTTVAGFLILSALAGCVTAPDAQRVADTEAVAPLVIVPPSTQPAAPPAPQSDSELKRQWYNTYDAVNKALPDSKLRDAITSIIVLIAIGVGWALNNISRIRQLIALFTPSPMQQQQSSPTQTTVVHPSQAPDCP